MLPKFIQCLHTFTAYIFPTFNLLFRPYSCKMCRLCWRKKEKNKHSRKENSFFCYFTHRWNEICVWVGCVSVFYFFLFFKHKRRYSCHSVHTGEKQIYIRCYAEVGWNDVWKCTGFYTVVADNASFMTWVLKSRM